MSSPVRAGIEPNVRDVRGGTRVEQIVLRDGSELVIRPVQPDDAALVAEGFAGLSPQSRQHRFLSVKRELSPQELRYFTEVDHHDHEALGAISQIDGRGVGIARYIRDPERLDSAEIAITILDSWQGRGLGTVLLSRLADHARQAGTRCFTALVAADNVAMAALLDSVGDQPRPTQWGAGTVEYEVELARWGLRDDLRTVWRSIRRRWLTAASRERAVRSQEIVTSDRP